MDGVRDGRTISWCVMLLHGQEVSVRGSASPAAHKPKPMMRSATMAAVGAARTGAGWRKFSTAPFRFDSETETTKVGEGLVSAFVSNKWSVGDAPNGGFLMTLAIKAAGHFSTHPDPLSMTAYYVNKAAENAAADLSVRVVSSSRSTTTLHVTLSQLGLVRSEYLGTFGDLSKMKGFTLVDKTAPQFPPIEDCHNASKIKRKALGDKLRIAYEIETRVPRDDPFARSMLVGKVGDKAELNAYVRFEDNRPPCLSSMAFFLDALPPPPVNVVATTWVPTLEYTVHFWDHPPQENGSAVDPWLRTTFKSSFIKNSLLYTDGEVWSADGRRLLATSRQFARVLDKR